MIQSRLQVCLRSNVSKGHHTSLRPFREKERVWFVFEITVNTFRQLVLLVARLFSLISACGISSLSFGMLCPFLARGRKWC